MTDPRPFLLGEGGAESRRSAPHVARNTAPILDILRKILPAEGLVLEVASGSGEQAIAFARAFPHLQWQPSDADPVALASIEAWRKDMALANLLPPLRIDASAGDWPVQRADAIVCINMVHISPWSATQGLLSAAGGLLGRRCPLYLYGPYRQVGVKTAPSNEAFDRSLRLRNAEWGLRHVEAVEAEAARHGLGLGETISMPANNLSLIFRKR